MDHKFAADPATGFTADLPADLTADLTADLSVLETEGSDAHWAFGTGFTDALAGVDTSFAAGTDRAALDALAARCLALGDDALIMAQRLAQWVTRAPELEEEVALANIGLDLLGQARLLLSRAAQAEGRGRDEDSLAFLREAREFRNVRLAELPNGDFACSMARLLVFSSWRLPLFERLRADPDPVLAAVAERGVKELAYHRNHAARWVVRLADGTEFSRERMLGGLAVVWPYVDELFTEAALCGVPAAGVRGEFDDAVRMTLLSGGLEVPGVGGVGVVGGVGGVGGCGGPDGRAGVHSAEFGAILDELQGTARSLPGAVW